MAFSGDGKRLAVAQYGVTSPGIGYVLTTVDTLTDYYKNTRRGVQRTNESQWFDLIFWELLSLPNPATRTTRGEIDVQARSCCASGGCCASGAGGPSLWTTRRAAWRGLRHREALRPHNNPHRPLCIPVRLLLPV